VRALPNVSPEFAGVWDRHEVARRFEDHSHTGELFDPDPAEQVFPAHRVQQDGMVGGHVPPDRPDDLVIVIAAGHEPAFAPD
jgi:hypothetical protein